MTNNLSFFLDELHELDISYLTVAMKRLTEMFSFFQKLVFLSVSKALF